MEKLLTFTPGYDAELQPKFQGYGRHGLVINIGVRHPQWGALIFSLHTGMYACQDQMARFCPSGSVYPTCTLHHPVTDPHFSEENLHESCGWLKGEPCVAYEPWGLTGPLLYTLYNTFILEGPEALQGRLAKELETLTCATT